MATANDEFVLCLNSNVYMSTITDLKKEDMLKMDVKPGRYKLTPFYDGCVFTEENYVPRLKDIVKIFSTRNSDKGLSGTYYGGESEDVHVLRLFNKYIKPKLHDDFLELFWSKMSYDEALKNCHTEEEEEMVHDYFDSLSSYSRYYNRHRKPVPDAIVLKCLPCYHNIPVLFFLTKPPENLDGFDLEMSGNLTEDIIVWKVKDGVEFIGYAVQSKYLESMMGDQAGIGVLSRARAFGNFESLPDVPESEENDDNEAVYDSGFEYECPFTPCNCSLSYYTNHDLEMRRKIKLELQEKYNSKNQQK